MNMSRREKDLAAVKALKVGESADVNMFQDGGAEVYNTFWGYVIYEIPLYGGEAQFYKHVKTAEDAIRVAYEELI